MMAKKAPSKRRSVPAEVEAPVSSQPAAARRSAETELRTLIAKFAPTSVRLVSAVRKSLRERLPTAHEVVYEYRDCCVVSYSPNDRGYEGVPVIRASPEGVKLYFNNGKELPDPDKLLQGSGKQTRWINLDRPSTLSRPEVATLIDAALARNSVPFEQAGTGSIVIRSTSAKQRRQRDTA